MFPSREYGVYLYTAIGICYSLIRRDVICVSPLFIFGTIFFPISCFLLSQESEVHKKIAIQTMND